MNKIYKTVWSEKKGAFVAVSEIVSSQGKSVSGSEESVIKQPANKLRTLASVLISAGFLFGAASQVSAQGIDALGQSVVGAFGADANYDPGNNTITMPTDIGGTGKGTIFGAIGSLQGGLNDANDAINVNTNTIAANKNAIEGTVNTLTGRVDQHENNISANTNAIGVNTSNITTNKNDIAALNTSLTTLGVDAKNPGIKYFRVKSTKDDANASGTDSVAIGPLAKATSTNTIALGHASEATGGNAVTFGYKAKASGTDGVAIGSKTQVIGINGIALGNQAEANTPDSISLGLAAGKDSVLTPGGDEKENIAIGANSGQRVKGQTNTALGIDAGQDVTGNQNVAIGPKAGVAVVGDDNISIGHLSNQNLSADSHRSIAIGNKANSATDALAFGTNSQATNHALAFGLNAQATGQGSVALGSGTVAISNSVALGNNSKVYSTDLQSDNVVSVGDSAAGGITRRIINVADGKKDSDAVTVKQLNDVINLGVTPGDLADLKTHVLTEIQSDLDSLPRHYVSIKTDNNASKAGNYSNNGATGSYAVAIGPDVGATADNSTAIGSGVSAAGVGSVALGTNIQANGLNSVTIGQGSESREESSIAIGTSSISRYENSIIIGKNAQDDMQGLNGPESINSIVIGTKAKSTNIDGMALGREAEARAERGIAQGVGAFAGDKDEQAVDQTKDAIAVGTKSYASANNAIAQGTKAQASAVNSTAIGNESKARGVSSIAFGNKSVARGLRSIAQGDNSEATAQDSQAFGTNAKALKVDSQAFGTSAVADGKNSQAFGKGANTLQENSQAFGTAASATGVNSQAFGAGAKALGLNSQAFGTEAFADHEDSTAIGNQAKSKHDGSVALGAGSETGDHRNGDYYINDSASGFKVAGSIGSGTRTVSVGKPGEERQIQNVAPGVVDEDSTDAINGSQLHATNTFANNLGTDTAKIFGGNTKLNPDGKLTDPNFKFDYDGTNKYQNVQDAMTGLQNLGLNFVGDDTNNVHRKLGQQLEITGGATGNLTSGNIGVTRNDDENGLLIQLAENIDLTEDGSVLTGIRNNNGDLVQGSELDKDGLAVKDGAGNDTTVSSGDITVAGGGNTIKINGAAGDITGLTNLTLDGPNFAQSGRAATEEQLKLVNATANAGWFLAAEGVTGSENIKPGDTATFKAGKNMQVTRAGADIIYSTSDEVEFDNITVGVTVINKDNGITTNKVVINHNGNDIDVGETLDSGITFVGDDGNKTEQKLGSELAIAGGDNINTSVEDGKVTVSLDKDVDLTKDGSLTVGATSITDNGLTITGGPSVTQNGIDAGNKQITNVASGLGGKSLTDVDSSSPEWTNAANIGDLVTASNELVETGLRFGANDGGVQTAALGSVVYVKGAVENDTADWANDFDGGQNIMTQIDKRNSGNNVIRVALSKNLAGLETVTVGENGAPGKDGDPGVPGIGLDGKDGVIGITGKDGIDGADGIAGMDGSSADITVKMGAPGIDGNDGVDGETKTRIVYEKPDDEVEEVATLNDGLYFAGNDGLLDDDQIIAKKLNERLDIVGSLGASENASSRNIRTQNNGDALEILMSDNPIFTSVQFGDNGPSITHTTDGDLWVRKDNNAPAKITNLAPGEISSTSTDAINGSQLQTMGDSLTQFFGGDMSFVNGEFNWEGYFESIFGDDSGVDSLAGALKPWNAGANGEDPKPVLPGDNVDISPAPGGGSGGNGGGTGVGGNGNIVVNLDQSEDGNHNYTLDLADDIHVNNSVTVGDKSGPYISMGDDSEDGGVGSPGSLNFYGQPDADGNRVSASQTVVGGPGGVGTDQEATDSTRLQYTDGDGNSHTLATLGDGLSFGANDGDQHDAPLNTRVDIVGADTNTDWSQFDGGQNIMTQVGTNEDGTGKITVALSNDIEVNSVTAETVNSTTVNATTVNTDSITINNGGPVINKDGINMNNNRITNVAPGIDGTDAVNVDQLTAVNNNLQQQIDGNRRDIKRNRDRANAGIAAAMATAGLPQAYLPGKSMVAAAGGVWRGESGFAIGVSTVSDNGKWVLKGSANTSSRGGAGGTIGAGYQW